MEVPHIEVLVIGAVDTGRDLATLRTTDIDVYFVTYGAQRWSRISAGHIANMLRVFKPPHRQYRRMARLPPNRGKSLPRAADKSVPPAHSAAHDSRSSASRWGRQHHPRVASGHCP
jgi:hypothetical protein